MVVGQSVACARLALRRDVMHSSRWGTLYFVELLLQFRIPATQPVLELFRSSFRSKSSHSNKSSLILYGN